jgi:hypothetical protein
MINFQVFGVAFYLTALTRIEIDFDRRVEFERGAQEAKYIPELRKFLDKPGLDITKVNSADLEMIQGSLEYATTLADRLELQAVHDRIEIFTGKLRYKLTLHEFVAEVRALREVFETGLKYKYLYLYPAQKAQKILRFQDEWGLAISGFPSIAEDVACAVDCYALDHNTAAVFHSMRVLEHGLREMAMAVNLVFDVQQWQTIIEQIEAQVRDIGDHWPKSAAKSNWMKFYSEAAKEFFYFKDGWRNYVSHGGAPYDEHQALGVLEHVRSFMNHLATRFSAAAGKG